MPLSTTAATRKDITTGRGASMQHRHYAAIADALRAATTFAIYRNSYDARSQHALTCNEMAIMLADTNPRFDRARFLTACGLDAETVDALQLA